MRWLKKPARAYAPQHVDAPVNPQENAPDPGPEPPAADPSALLRAAPLGHGRAENEYVLIMGTKGSGKTTCAEIAYRARIAAGGSGTWISVTGKGTHLGRVVRTPREWWAYVRAQLAAGLPFSAVVVPDWPKPGEKRTLDALWEGIYRVGRQLVVLDEAQFYANSQRIDPGLANLVDLGRNAEVDIITTTRLSSEVHGKLSGNRDVVVAFRQERRYYAERINDEFFGLPNGADLIMRLPRFHYLRASQGRVTRGDLHPLPWEKSSAA